MFFKISETKTKGDVLTGFRSIYSAEKKGSVQHRVFSCQITDQMLYNAATSVASNEGEVLRIKEEFGIPERVSTEEIAQLIVFCEEEEKRRDAQQAWDSVRGASSTLRTIAWALRREDANRSEAVAIYGQLKEVVEALEKQGYRQSECIKAYKDEKDDYFSRIMKKPSVREKIVDEIMLEVEKHSLDIQRNYIEMFVSEVDEEARPRLATKEELKRYAERYPESVKFDEENGVITGDAEAGAAGAAVGQPIIDDWDHISTLAHKLDVYQDFYFDGRQCDRSEFLQGMHLLTQVRLMEYERERIR